VIGRTLSHYKITAKLGEGGMGEVYRAEDTQLGREVAVKVLPKTFSRDSDRRARFEREARAIAALSHPNILAIYDFGSEEGASFVVTELLEGETLRQRLAHGPVASRKAAAMGCQIAEGLAAAHDKGIVHRDLKPENLFLSGDGRIKILDFGLASAGEPGAEEASGSEVATFAPLTSPGTVLGTVGYMSPEQVRGEPADHRSDIFSFGCVLYELVSGAAPFKKDTHAETMAAILKEEPAAVASLVPDIPPALGAIIVRCLERSIGERFHSAHDLAFSLRALSDSNISTRAIAALPGVSGRRWRTGAAGMVGLLLLGLLIGGVASPLLRPPPTAAEPPSFTSLSSRRGTVTAARFVPGEASILYSASWDGGPLRLYRGARGTRTSEPVRSEEADLLSISSTGEQALSLDRRHPFGWEAIGTLAVARPGGSAPRELLENVLFADWAPDGKSLAVAHEVNGVVRLEYPIGTVLYESPGWISDVRVHRDGDRVLIADNPARGDSEAVVKIVDRKGAVETLTRGGSWGVLWAPDGESVWYSSGDLFSVRPGEPPRRLFGGPQELQLLDVDASGTLLVAPTSSRREMIVRTPGADADTNLSWLDWTVPKILSSDGRWVLFEEGYELTPEGYAIYLREMSGAAPLLVGYGSVVAMSPDARWIAMVKRWSSEDPELALIPTGPGQPRMLDVGDLHPLRADGAWIAGAAKADPGALLFAGRDGNGAVRMYHLPLTDGGAPRAITPPDFALASVGLAISIDGSRALVKPADGAAVEFDMNGDGPWPVAGLTASDLPLRFDRDGVHLYVLASSAVPAPIVRVDTATGKRSSWRELTAIDPAGVFIADYVRISADGAAHAFTHRRMISHLALMEGLK
jgi:serine/threonine protein kinase